MINIGSSFASSLHQCYIGTMCQTYLNLYYSPTTQIYSVLTPVYMTYETLSIGSWLNCLCVSRLIDYH